MPQVQNQAELHSKFQESEHRDLVQKEFGVGGVEEWRGRYHPNKNKSYCTADTGDVPEPHLFAPPTHLPGTDANEQ